MTQQRKRTFLRVYQLLDEPCGYRVEWRTAQSQGCQEIVVCPDKTYTIDVREVLVNAVLKELQALL
jgi:hypothetical protein